MAHQLSKKDIVKEIMKCGKDPKYFLNNYGRISHPMHGLIPFRTYDFQADLLDDFNDYRFNIILKARQLGISTISAGYVVWLMLFHRDKNILVMATKFSTAANLVKKVKSIMKNVPGLDELWTGLYPTLSTGGRCIALSTPNGVGNWFHKTYADSARAANDFHPTNLPWHVHPDRDQNWFDKETKNMSARQIAQELECNFNTSGETVIHPDDIKRILGSLREPRHKTGFDRNIWIWEEYDPDSTYLLSADVARGDGKDSSAFHILKAETMEVAVEYKGKPTIDAYANMLNHIGMEYGNCLLVVENVGVGISVLDKLYELEYPNLYYSIKSTHEFVDSVQAEGMPNSVPGFTTSSKTRPLVIAKLEEFVRNKLITLYSSRIADELKTFIWNNGRPQAMRSYSDDLIMALAIACWVKDTALEVNKRDIEYSKAIMGGIMTTRTSLNTTIEGQTGHEKNNLQNKKAAAISQQKEFLWLYKG